MANNFPTRFCFPPLVVLALASNPLFAAVAEPAHKPIVDVQLSARGMLQGQVVDPSGQAKSDVEVTVRCRDGIVATAKTDAHGRFAARLPRGGVYEIAHADSHVLCRAWTNATAPPSAGSAVLLVSGETVALGQSGGTTDLLLFGGITAAALSIGVVEATNGS